MTVTIRKPHDRESGKQSLLAGHHYDVECETTGSRPPAVITWYKGKRPLRHVKVRYINNSLHGMINFPYVKNIF